MKHKVSQTRMLPVLSMLLLLAAVPPAATAQDGTVFPIVERIIDNGDGTVTATFGYLNAGVSARSLSVGAGNFFEPEPFNRGQPTFFELGRHYDVFEVTFSEPTLTWNVDANPRNQAVARRDEATSPPAALFDISDEAGMTRFFLEGTGNMALGHTAPRERLDVDGRIRTSGGIIFSDGSVLLSASAIREAQLPNLYFDNNNVGIGTTPAERLDVDGRIRTTGGLIFPDGTLQVSAAETVDLPNLFFANNNVGIGVTNPTERLQVAGRVRSSTGFITNGNTGIGTFSPHARLHVTHPGTSAGNPWGVRIQNTSQSSFQGGIRLSNAGFLEITNNALSSSPNYARLNSTGSWTVVSDKRLKQDVTPADGLLDAALALQPVFYRSKASPNDGPEFGLIAQEVREVFPELVSEGELLTVDYARLSVVALAALREQQAEIETLKQTIAELESLFTTVMHAASVDMRGESP